MYYKYIAITVKISYFFIIYYIAMTVTYIRNIMHSLHVLKLKQPMLMLYVFKTYNYKTIKVCN